MKIIFFIFYVGFFFKLIEYLTICKLILVKYLNNRRIKKKKKTQAHLCFNGLLCLALDSIHIIFIIK